MGDFGLYSFIHVEKNFQKQLRRYVMHVFLKHTNRIKKIFDLLVYADAMRIHLNLQF